LVGFVLVHLKKNCAKSIALSVSCFCLFYKSTNKITNENILGKWQAHSLKIEDFAFYDSEKDSLSFLGKMLEKIKHSGEDSLKTADEFKTEIGKLIKTTSFAFKKDGRVELTVLQEKFEGNYELNESKQTVVIKSNAKGTVRYLIELKGDKLLLTELGIDTTTIGLKKL